MNIFNSWHKNKGLWVHCRIVSSIFFSPKLIFRFAAGDFLVQDHVTATGKRRRVSTRISPHGKMVPPVALDTALTYSLDNHVSTALDNVLQMGPFFRSSETSELSLEPLCWHCTTFPKQNVLGSLSLRLEILLWFLGPSWGCLIRLSTVDSSIRRSVLLGFYCLARILDSDVVGSEFILVSRPICFSLV